MNVGKTAYPKKLDRNEEMTFPISLNGSREDGEQRGTAKKIEQEVDSEVTPIGMDVGMTESVE